MLSPQQRCIYGNNQLAEVICQLRFPEILTIETTLPAAFQEAVREIFPLYTLRKDGPANTKANNHQFATADNRYRINLTSKFISLTCTRYTCWEDFARILDKPLVTLIQLYKPAFFDRIGLRYLNFFSRQALDMADTPFKEMFAPSYLGLLAEEDIPEQAISRSSVEAEIGLPGGCRVKIHAGPGKVAMNGNADPEVKFIFDQDLFLQGNIPVNSSVDSLQMLHSHAYPIFRGAVTDLVHRAMDPDL